MDEVVRIFQDRLCEMAKIFLRLLENVEKSRLFTLSESHCEYRMEYLGHMITTTLESQQEKTIRKLVEKIKFISEQSNFSTSSRFSSAQLEIPSFFEKEVQKRDQDNKKTRSTIESQSPLSSKSSTPAQSMHRGQNRTKNNQLKIHSLESEQESEQPTWTNSSDESVMSYKFKYLKIKM